MDFKKLLKEIESFDSISLFRHIRPDFDAYGSQLGLAQMLRDNYPNKKIFLHGSFSDELGVKMFQHDFERKNKDYDNTLAIILDTGNGARVDDPNWNKFDNRVKFDHHPNVIEEITENSYVDTNWSATSEGLIHFAKEVKWTITKEAAKWLYIGLIGDNGRFLYPSTTTKTYEAALMLAETDLDRNSIHDSMYVRSLDDWKFAQELSKAAEFTENGVGYIIVNDEIVSKYKGEGDFTKKYVNLLAGIDGVRAWAMINFLEDTKEWKISIRTRRVTVNDIMYDMEIGGGHAFACAGRHKDINVLKEVINKIDERLKNNK